MWCVYVVVSVQTLNYETTLWGENIGMDLWLTLHHHAIEIKTYDDHRALIEIDMLQVSPGRHTNWPGLQVQIPQRRLLMYASARP